MTNTINKLWHEKHRMPKNPLADQRIAWHFEHSKHCGCHEIPAGVLGEMKKRGIQTK